MTRCPHCGGPGTLLLLSIACDRCDAPQSDEVYLGWIVYRGRPPGSLEYVFRTEAHAAAWRQAAGLEQHPTRMVETRTPFRWRASNGSVAGIEIADTCYEIYPAYSLGTNRACLYVATEDA